MVTAHMKEFYEAERTVRGKKLSKNLTESEELDLAIAEKYKDGKLHAAASLAFSDTKMAQQGHLRSVVVRLLPQVLPANMLTSRAVTVLIQELVTCAVLAPVVLILADPDTWNQLIANAGRAILQERKSVKKLRAALDEHAQTSPRTTKHAPFPRLAAGDNEKRFERFIRAIRKCSTLSDARRFRSEVATQLHKESSVEGQDPVFIRRLETGKRALDQRISQLGADRSMKNGRSALPSSEDSSRSSAARMESTSLRDVLYSATGLSYFMEYMDRVHLMKLVQFWIVVDGSRNPLEDDGDEPSEVNDISRKWTDADRTDVAQINEAYLSQPEIKLSPLAREAIRTFLQAGAKATNTQYIAARKAIVRAQIQAYEDMQDPHFANFKKSDLWFKLLAAEEAAGAPSWAAVAPASPISQSSERRSLDSSRPAKPTRLHTGPQKLKAPDLRRQVASTSDLKGYLKVESDNESNGRKSLDNRRPLFDDDLDSDALANSIASIDSDLEVATPITEDDPQVIDAMQEALNDIIDEPADKESLLSDGSLKARKDTDSMLSSMELTRATSPATGVLKKGKPSAAALGLFGTPGKRSVFDEDLFAAEQPKFLEDEREDSAGSDRDDDDAIVEAAPGDLGLAEAIDALTLDIEKLVTQDSILESLTKKAELTNNAAELRILRKSKASLQREINRKELQRQQFIVQESDNGLYGRASIAIQSVMVGKDDEGKEYAVYVIEVRRQAGDQMPAALWIVSRRYSEFHELNKRLRGRFPIIRNLDFPRRQIGLKLQRDFLQKRKIALERYLQELLKIPAVCRSRELRAFLSAHALPSSNPGNAQVDQKDFVSRLYSSVTDGMEEFLGNVPVLDQLSLAGQNLISAATSQLNAAQSPTAPSGIANQELAATAEAEAELRAFEARELEPFVKPICDLFLETFELNRENNWLRGRAVVIVLQQLLGGTIERKIRDNARSHLSDEGMAKYINMVVDIMWPNGVKKSDGVPRTTQEKARSKQEAGVVLNNLVPEFVGSVVGRTNAQAAAKRILAVVNNQRLL
jgi:sorting nexin-25